MYIVYPLPRVAKLSNKQVMDKVLIIDFGSQMTSLLLEESES